MLVGLVWTLTGYSVRGVEIAPTATIEELQALQAAGTLSARELVEFYLARIAETDRSGPAVNSVIELNPDARAIADERDAERRAGRVRGPLHGIPVLLKDNIATADRMETTAGSLAMVGSKPQRDAFLIDRLRASGAVILGKTNLSEWANFRGDRGVGGWSGRGGRTRNPYALDRSPNGSSSGSGVAVAANLCVVAVGTETNGSIIGPASANGVVGIKPTLGAVSRTGVIPIAASYDTAGPFGRTVRDAALALAAIVGADPDDVATVLPPRDFVDALLRPFPANALKGTRLGIVRVPDMKPDMNAPLEEALRVLRAAGAEIVEIGEFPKLREARSAALVVMTYEMKAGVNAYLATLGPSAKIKSLADVIRFNDEHWAQEQPLFGQQILLRAEAKGPLTEPEYLAALATSRRLTRDEGIDALMKHHRLDALLAVANAPARLSFPPATGDPLFGPDGPSGSGYGPAATAGYPSVSVPMTQVHGLPVGLLFYGGAWSEPKLLAYAADFERRTQARRDPTFPASASAATEARTSPMGDSR